MGVRRTAFIPEAVVPPASGMRLERIGKLELAYTDIDTEFPFADGGQVYGILKGTLETDGLRGRLHTTNLARQRPDGTFTPKLRGILTTPDGATVFFAMDGLSVKDPAAAPPRRIVTAAITFWSVEPALRAWNDVFVLAELEGRAMGDSWGVSGPVYRCVPEI
jgi:hypothetical protein